MSGAPVRQGRVRFEGLVSDLCSDKCLNLSDRCFLERKKSAGVGQAFTRLCEKWDIGVVAQPPIWGIVGKGALVHSRIRARTLECPRSARHCWGGAGDPLQMKLQVPH